MPHATPLWAGLLALLYLALSLRVIGNRRRAQVAIGHGKDRLLERAIRAHANFAEYVPMALILMVTAELSGARSWILHPAGLALFVGRCIHAYGIVHESDDLRLRPFGMGLTFAAIAVLAIACLFHAFR